MGTITYLTSLVQQAISRLNNYEANAKKVDELPHQTSLNTNSKIPVSRAGVSEYITVDQIASAIQNGNYNQLLAVGSITVNELTNEIIVASGVSAQINGSIYQTTSDTTIPITLCPAGFTRKDILVLTTSNTVIAISGEETDGAIVLAPPTPLDAIYITEFDVNDTAIGTPSDPILGAQFKQKTENQSYNYSTTGSNVILPLRGEGQNHYIVDNEDLVSVDGFDKTVLILVRNSEAPPYEGKDYLFENKSPNPVQLNHLTSAEIPFSLPNEENLIVPAGGAVWFKYKSDVLVFIMKSWNDPVISNFKGKFTSKANLDAAFPSATDGDYAIVDAGTGSDAIEYIWDNEEGWVLGNSVGASTTDALVEGSTNLYFQTTRVLATALSGLSLLTGGAIVFTDTVLQAFGKLQKQINDLTSGKLDKSTTPSRVYGTDVSGNQNMIPVSNFKDVIEGYFNGTNFYTDALFTNLITPESGKIYINIAVTPATQYRWSGSAYVSVGGVGGSETLLQKAIYGSDFISYVNNTNVGQLSFTDLVASGNGNCINIYPTTNKHDGVVLFRNQNSTNIFYRFQSFVMRERKGLYCYFEFAQPLNTLTNPFIKLGFSNNNNTALTQFGALAEITNSAISFKNYNNSVVTSSANFTLTKTTNNTTPVFYKLLVYFEEVNQVRYILRDDSNGLIANVLLTTNAPVQGATPGMTCISQIYNALAEAQQDVLILDKQYFGFELPTALNFML